MIYQGEVTMAFKQECFIRKNTPELQKKLALLGYRHNIFDKNDRPWLAANYGLFISVDEGFQRLNPTDIDCGTNEEMFLALAALRDDSDYMQWFICGDGESMFKVDKPGMTVDEYDHNYMDGWDTEGYRKATVEEIVEHFNNRNNEHGTDYFQRGDRDAFKSTLSHGER